MITVLVTGASGCLGREVTRYARRQFNVVALDHFGLDITDPKAVEQVFVQNKINVVINCAGIVKGRRVFDSTMISVNALGPHILANMCAKYWSRLIHVSTDCVFSGQYGPYTEDSRTDPSDLYGRTKLVGEITSIPHLTVRTSFIGYGQHGLLNWLLNSKDTVPGYVDSVWNGITAPVLARMLVELVKKSTVRGLLHIGGEPISKYDLLCQCVEAFKLNINVVPSPAPMHMRVNRSLYTIKDAKLLVPPMPMMLSELVRYKPYVYKSGNDNVLSIPNIQTV